jgi:hypothetical protein
MSLCKCGHPPNNHFCFDKKPCAHCDCKALDVVPHSQEQALRQLRMWHWQQALKATKTQRSKLGSKSSMTKAKNAWKLHMGAVQLLNDLVPGTAEEDCNDA